MEELSDKLIAKVYRGIGTLSDRAFFIYRLRDNSFVELSHSFNSVLDFLPQQVYENPVVLLQGVHEEDRSKVKGSLMKVIDEGMEKQEVRFRMYGKGDQIKHIIATVHSLTVEGERLLCGFVEDVSAAEQERIRLEKVMRTKDFVLDVMAHNLSGPLQRTKMLLSFLKEYLPTEKEHEAHSIFSLLEKCNGTSIKIINSFVKQELLEAGRIEVKKQRVNLSERIRELFNSYRQLVKYSEKELVLETPNNSDFFVEVDEVKFVEAIKNLFTNAIKFTKENGKITITLEHAEGFDLIKVADNGIGIPKELQPYLFDKFTKARRTGLKGEESVGLGMGIVAKIVELHQGKIWLESEEEKGTTFLIKIPPLV